MVDWTRLEQPDIVPGDRPLTGYDDFGNVIFLPPAADEPAPRRAAPSPWSVPAVLLAPSPPPPASRLN